VPSTSRSSTRRRRRARSRRIRAAGGEPIDRALVVAGWQRGLCVVNTVAQAAEVGGFDEEDLAPAEAGRWYSMMEGAPVVITHPERIALGYGGGSTARVIHNEGEIRIGRGSLLAPTPSSTSTRPRSRWAPSATPRRTWPPSARVTPCTIQRRSP